MDTMQEQERILFSLCQEKQPDQSITRFHLDILPGRAPAVEMGVLDGYHIEHSNERAGLPFAQVCRRVSPSLRGMAGALCDIQGRILPEYARNAASLIFVEQFFIHRICRRKGIGCQTLSALPGLLEAELGLAADLIILKPTPLEKNDAGEIQPLPGGQITRGAQIALRRFYYANGFFFARGNDYMIKRLPAAQLTAQYI